MTTSDVQVIFQCSKCEYELDMESKTLTCLHSLCGKCIDQEFQGETSGNVQCPECHEIVKLDQLTLSPVLVSSLKCRKLESTEWKCDFCLGDGNESFATTWCKDCVKTFCDKCNRVHERLLINHNSMKLDEKGKDEIRQIMGTNLCNIHKKVEESYCGRCNACFCDMCYKTHLKESPQCPPRPILVSEEALKKRISQGPTLLNEIEDYENNLLERNRKFRIYSEELERECRLECKEIWQNYEDILKELRGKMTNMCEELRLLKDEQIKKWRQLVEENERLLKKLEIWRINLRHLLKKNQKEKDIVCGVELIGTKLSSSLSYLHQKITEPVRKFEFGVKFSDYWLQFIEGLENKMIASCSLHHSANSIKFENEWNLPKSNLDRYISSILVSQNDSHLFLADHWNNSIIELTESGELIYECILIHEGKNFYPREMFFTSSEMLGVNCGCGKKKEGKIFVEEEKLIFLERNIFSPFLKIKTIIEKKKENPSPSYSLCQIKKTILICEYWKFQIDFYTEDGKYIKTIDTGESAGGDWPRIRADPSTGNFWGLIPNTCEIFCFNQNGKKLESLETKETILSFSINDFGDCYVCNLEGIFSFFLEKKLHEFQKKSESFPAIFASSRKIFVCLQIDKQYLIKIFKILD